MGRTQNSTLNIYWCSIYCLWWPRPVCKHLCTRYTFTASVYCARTQPPTAAIHFFNCEVLCRRYIHTYSGVWDCGYQVLSPRSYRLIGTLILQGHPGSSGALWGYPRYWPPSVRFRAQLTSVCLHTSPLTNRYTCYGTTVPHSSRRFLQVKSWTVWMVETQLCKLRGTSDTFVSVSYTHLTLPTICSV